MRQHRRREQQRQHLAFLRLPVDFRRRQRELIFDADLLGDGFGSGAADLNPQLRPCQRAAQQHTIQPAAAVDAPAHAVLGRRRQARISRFRRQLPELPQRREHHLQQQEYSE